jgi:hypothetical protein
MLALGCRQGYRVRDVVTVGGGVYGGGNAGMPRTAGDIMVYGYANIFKPGKLTTADLVERIKFSPAWPMRIVPAASLVPAGAPAVTEAVGKVEVEYTDKFGVVNAGTGLKTFSQRYDQSGIYYASWRSVYSFPQ